MSIRQRHRTLLVIIIGALVLSCLPGCDRSGGKLPGNLYLRLSANPTTLDPALITDVTGGLIAAKLFNGLVRFNERLEIVPDLAGSWKVSSDHRTY
ncbi:MAG: extracellular solute-binding protein family 5, partial [Nitrospirae bacterium]|nr:extracellular solute-binding protein family 5 [Nitrospirota bacterium]